MKHLLIVCVGMFACGDQIASDADASLIATVTEPPGLHCANGGQAIETGVDRNDDGILDADEVTATTYVCGGSPGAATLVDVVAEAPGTHCTNGGQAIETGVDANGNGVLDPSEVSQTTYVCAGAANATVIFGGFTVNNSIDAAELVGVTMITGDLTIDAVGLSAIDFGSLHSVSGTINYLGFSGTTLAMPVLTSARDLFVQGVNTAAPLDVPVLATVSTINFDQYAFTTASFPALMSIGTLTVEPSDTLTALSYPVLTTAGDVSIRGCSAITSLDFSHLVTADTLDLESADSLATLSLGVTSVGSLQLLNLPALTTIDLSALTTTSRNIAIASTALTTLDFPSLASIGGGMYIGTSVITSLSFPVLTSVSGTQPGNVAFNSNSALTSIDVPLWTTFGPPAAMYPIQVAFNPHLPTCLIQNLFAQIGAVSASAFGNDDSGSCP